MPRDGLNSLNENKLQD